MRHQTRYWISTPTTVVASKIERIASRCGRASNLRLPRPGVVKPYWVKMQSEHESWIGVNLFADVAGHDAFVKAIESEGWSIIRSMKRESHLRDRLVGDNDHLYRRASAQK